MKPNNERPDLLLADHAPVTCYFMARADAPVFWERCEQNATEVLPTEVVDGFNRWRAMFPTAIIMLYPGSLDGSVYTCDAHSRIIREAHA